MTQTMKAVRFTQNGNKLQLNQTTQEIPSLGKNEVLIKVKAASLNFRDHAALSGNYPGASKWLCQYQMVPAKW